MTRLLARGLVAVIICLSAAACGSSAQTPQALTVEQAAATLVSVTMEAATQIAAMQPPTRTSAAEPTPTFATPRLVLTTEVRCRSGIGPNFKVLATLPQGTTLDLLGKASALGAWLVRVPNSTDMCWVLVLDSSPSGNFQDVPEVTPQPGAGTPPSAPVNIGWPFYCSYVDGVLYQITIQLSWTNTASDANGFRIYRQETQIADLPVTESSFTDVSKVELGTDLTYSIEAYNEAGPSPRLRLTIPRVCT